MKSESQLEAEEKAMFCLALKIAPSEYDGLTYEERDAFIRVFNEDTDAHKAQAIEHMEQELNEQ